jgi:glutathione-regulated potassium-efflux system ancillary protein KefC/glutathione-regulated potassium-efflux system protein KefB
VHTDGSFMLQMLVFLGAALVAVPITRALGIGSVLGYLLGGIVVGPPVLGLVTDVDGLLHFSEFGVVLLLFVIGLELHPRRLWILRQAIFVAGGAQMAITTLVLGAVAALLLDDWRAGMVIGFALSLSSTAFVLQTLAEKKRLTTPAGRSAFGILLFQDLAIVPGLALLPLLAGGMGEGIGLSDWLLPVGAVAAVLAGGRYAMRPLLRIVAGTGIHELFTAATLLLVLGTAMLMEAAGLSAGLGAFLAGVLVADSEFRHQLETDILPFKGLLLGLFFMAVGMNVDLALLLDRPFVILSGAIALLALKAALLLPVARATGLRTPESGSLALMLAQGGEFAFVLFGQPAVTELVTGDVLQVLTLIVILSMALTPLLFVFDGWRRSRADALPEVPEAVPEDVEHEVVIAGFGRFGQVVGRLLSMAGIRFTAIELSALEVDFVRRFGHEVIYGDARRLDVLRNAHVDRARTFVIAVDDAEASIAIARLVREQFPRLNVLARARNRQHVFQLRDLGIAAISRDTLLSAVELGGDVLEAMGMAPEQVAQSRERFLEHDKRTLEDQYATHLDGEAYVQAVRLAAADLRALFEADARGGPGTPPANADPL